MDRQRAERQILDGKVDCQKERQLNRQTDCCVSNENSPWLLILVLSKNPALPD